MIVIKVIRRIRSYLKLCFFKLLYRNNFKINGILNSYLGKGTNIKINHRESKIFLSGKFYCRDYVILNVNGGSLHIGQGVFFNNNCTINCKEEVVIGDNCLLGEGVKIYDHDHKFKGVGLIKEQGFSKGQVMIGNNTWIGSNCIILKGVRIGDNVVIAAGTTVQEDVPSNHILYSNLEVKKKEYNRP